DSIPPISTGASRARETGIEPEHEHVARGAVTVTLKDLDRGRLARPVWPEKGEDLAGLDLEIYAAERLVITVGMTQAADGYGRLRRGSMVRPPPIRCLRAKRAAQLKAPQTRLHGA